MDGSVINDYPTHTKCNRCGRELYSYEQMKMVHRKEGRIDIMEIICGHCYNFPHKEKSNENSR
jgi:ribosomal protein L37E